MGLTASATPAADFLEANAALGGVLPSAKRNAIASAGLDLARERPQASHGCSGRERDRGYPPGKEAAAALPPRSASCATPDAWHNWHGRRYENPPDMVIPRVCCEILQVCPVFRRLLLRVS